jgi:death-on-curing protein
LTVYLELGDYCEIAAELLGTNTEQIARLPRIALADSALATPSAGFGDQDAYPTMIEKAAALVEHLARNHPLPDGNKRASFLSVWLFMEQNKQPFAGEDPDTDVPMVERIAAGEPTPNEIAAWLEKRTVSAGEGEVDSEA